MKVLQPLRSTVDFFKEQLRYETPEFLEKKLKDHSEFAGTMYVLGALLGCGLWTWDFVTDPEGAKNTLHLRLLFLIFLVAPYLFKTIKNATLLAASLITLTLLTEALYLHILTKLQMGMVYGIGGFMYYLLLPPLAFEAFSLRTNIVYVLSIALFPHLLAFAGLAPGFEHLHYAVLIWPAALLTILIQFVYARTYRERYEFEKELRRLSYTDPLSGLYNRRSFMEQLQKEIRRFEREQHPFSLLILDIDFFKRINDTYGHQWGDRTIAQISARIQKTIRSMDIPARIGGEEFAVILPGTDAQEARRVAERIRKGVEQEPFVFEKEKLRVTVSVGLATMHPGLELSSLFKKADDALYLAKRMGRNRVESAS